MNKWNHETATSGVNDLATTRDASSVLWGRSVLTRISAVHSLNYSTRLTLKDGFLKKMYSLPRKVNHHAVSIANADVNKSFLFSIAGLNFCVAENL